MLLCITFKKNLLMRLLKSVDAESVLVFTRTKVRATRLATTMKRAGFYAASLQGDMPQQKRQAALKGFRNGTYKILVATDIAARGIDVSGISHVINYDMPDTVDAYTHRIGRTGRAARTGEAFTFVTSKDRAFVWTIENILGEKIERRTVEDFDYTVPAPAGSSGFVPPQRPMRQRRAIKSIDEFPGHRAVASSTAGNSRSGSHQLSRGLSLFTSSRTKTRRSRRSH